MPLLLEVSPLLQEKTLPLLLFVLVAPVAHSAVRAQSQPEAAIELIVRPVDDAPDSFVSRLRTPSTKAGGDSLLAGVVSSHPTFSGQVAPGKREGEEREPIPAHTLVVRDSSSLRALRRRLEAQQEVQYVQSNVEFSVDAGPNLSRRVPLRADLPLDPDNAFADSLDHLSVIHALGGWEVTAGTTSVSVGVVDTGIYFDHPDLSGQFRVNASEDANGDGAFGEGDRNGVDDDGNGYADDVIGYDFVDRPNAVVAGEYTDRDPDPSPDPKGALSGHGTAVAGVISAAAADPTEGVVGVAPRTKVVALRAFGGDGRGRTDDIAAAIVYGAQQDVDVLNLSFGRSRSAPLLKEAIEYAVSRGTVVVGSAGNEGAVDDPHYPSDYPEVISVMWLAEDGEGVPDFSRSQHGIGVDLGAPGSNVFTTQFPRARVRDEKPVRTEDLYGPSSGSSFSAPQGAGAAALLRSVDSTLSPTAIQSILTGTAADLRGVSWDHTTGAGRIDIQEGLLRSYPAQTELHFPEHNQGFVGNGAIPVVGTALDPSFQTFGVYYAEGTRNLDRREDPWIPIREPTARRVHRDTLATWDLSALNEGAYTLRLVTTLTDGRTIEDRRRVVIDRSAPAAEVQFLEAGRVNGHWGILADLVSDDTVRSRMHVEIRGKADVRRGEFEASRQALTWADESGLGGEAAVEITLTNRSGLTTTIEHSISVPEEETNPSYFSRRATGVPNGHLLPEATDFDGDALPEVVFNQFEQGGLSDSLRSFEWSPSGFASSDTLLARLFPKDVGDTNRDGEQELLLQIRGATILLEQSGGAGLPRQLVYADTAAVTPSQEGPSLHGALLTDLDADGQGEIVGNWKPMSGRTRWRVLERNGDAFVQTAELENPTELGRSDTLRSSPEAATGDFDGDGRRDLLVGDRDGNWIVYESTGDDQFEVAWTHETDRFGADTRFAVGDMTGDGQEEFVTYSTYNRLPLEGGEFEAPISVYHVWGSVGDDRYREQYRLPVAGERSRQGSMTAADFDGDERAEIAVAHPPSLMVLDVTGQNVLEVVYEDRGRPSVLSPSLATGDFDGDGTPSLVAATTGTTLRRYVVNESALVREPPRWVRAIPGGASSSRLAWRAPGADSVTVYAGDVDGTLDPVSTRVDSSATIKGTAEQRFALRAWSDGTGSPLSVARVVRPHAPAVVQSVDYPDPGRVRLRFTEPLAASVRADQFQLNADRSPHSLVRTNGDTGVVLQFGDTVAGTDGRLSWGGLTDASGLVVGQTEVNVEFPAAEDRTLFVEDLDILAEQRIQLTFSAPLDGQAARETDRYEVEPHGFVESVEAEGATPSSVTVHLDGIVAGATGQEASLTVTSMQSAAGARLVEEGATVRLTQPANGLQDVFVYPNPVRVPRQGSELAVAGLPPNATIRIFSPTGRLVQVLSVQDGRRGGTIWDLRDRRGRLVPSGIYLIRVEAPDTSPVLKKAAVIR